MSFYIRVWQAFEAAEISKHLLIVGDVSADCSNCRELGLNWVTAKTCPKCATPFKYVASRTGGSFHKNLGGTVRRVKEKRPDLTFIDYDDFREVTGKKQARDFFSS